MSEQIREQISAFLDGELPASETELLLKRLTRDAELRESFGRFALIGESLRANRSPLSRGFALRVNATIDGEPTVASAPLGALRVRPTYWWRPIAGAAVAAGVAAVAVVALQQRTVTPVKPIASTAPAVVQMRSSTEPARPYVVPAAAAAVPASLPPARLTNYIFAHSRYSSMLGQGNVLSGLLSDPNDPSVTMRPASSPSVNDAALHQAVSSPQDTPTAP